MSLRLAAYAVCINDERVLLSLSVPRKGGVPAWTLPGGRVEPNEDPIDTVIRELSEETGCTGTVDRLLGVDSRVVPFAERISPGDSDLHNVGIFYGVQVTGGQLRPEPNGDTAESIWTPTSDVSGLRRSSLVDIGLSLAQHLPSTGHVEAVPVVGLVQH